MAKEYKGRLTGSQIDALYEQVRGKQNEITVMAKDNGNVILRGIGTSDIELMPATPSIVVETFYIDDSVALYTNAEGVSVALPAGCRYGFIPVEAGQTFRYSGKATAQVIGVAAFGDDFTYLYPIIAERTDAIINKSICEDEEFQIPEGVAYIAICTRDKTTNPLRLSRVLDVTKRIIDNVDCLISYNVFDGIGFNIDQGATYISSASQITDYIPVKEGELLRISGSFPYSAGLGGFDENKNFIGGIARKFENSSPYTFGIVKDALVRVPHNVAYIRMSSNNRSEHPIVIKRVLKQDDFNKQISLYQNDYQYAWFGDSISHICSLTEAVEKKISSKIWNCAFAGSPLIVGSEISQKLSFLNIANCIANEDFTTIADAIEQMAEEKDVSEHRISLQTLETINWNQITHAVIFAGTNDLNASATTIDKIKSGFSEALQTFINKNPHISLYVILPPYRRVQSNSVNGLTILDINLAIKEVAEEFNIPCLDFFKTCGVNPFNEAYYLDSVGLHPNEFGSAMWSTKLANWLKSL
jgi:lysophospholipase L1-like esterase